MLFLLLACTNLTKESGMQDTAISTPNELQLSFDAAIQRSDWGNSLGRCSVKVAFTWRPDSDQMGDAPGQLWDPMNVPENDGDCAVTVREPVAMQEALDAQDPPEDNWILVGHVDMGSHVQLVSDSRTIELLPTYDEDGLLEDYQMADCNESTFPFDDTFDLVVPEGSVAENIDPFTLTDAAVIGPEMRLIGLGAESQILSSQLDPQDDFPIAWSYDDNIDTPVPLDHNVYMTLRNNIIGGINEFEAIMCLADPADGSMPTSITIPANDLAQLTPNPSPGGPYVLGIQLDSRTNGPDIDLPGGKQRIRMSSVISIDGTGELVE